MRAIAAVLLLAITTTATAKHEVTKHVRFDGNEVTLTLTNHGKIRHRCGGNVDVTTKYGNEWRKIHEYIDPGKLFMYQFTVDDVSSVSVKIACTTF